MKPYSEQDITRAILHMKHQRIVYQTALEGELNATRKEMHMDELNACACALYALERMMGDDQDL